MRDYGLCRTKKSTIHWDISEAAQHKRINTHNISLSEFRIRSEGAMPSEKYFAVGRKKATNAAASFFFWTAMFALSTSNGEGSAKTLLTTVNSFRKVVQLGPERGFVMLGSWALKKNL